MERVDEVVAMLRDPELRVTATMATMPGREGPCLEALKSLRCQVDHLVLAVEPRGSWAPPREHRRLVDVVRFVEPKGHPGGDWTKMTSSESVYDQYAPGGVVMRLTVDDDLRYPSDYTKVHAEAWASRLERYGLAGSRAFLGVHASRFVHSKETDYRRGALDINNRCLSPKVLHRHQVHVLGTGTLSALVTNTWNVLDSDALGCGCTRSRFFADMAFGEERNVADLHLAAFAQRHRIPLESVPTPRGAWLENLLTPRMGTIWNDGLDPKSAQVENERAVMSRAVSPSCGGGWRLFQVHQCEAS
jgi:hypothetical protein